MSSTLSTKAPETAMSRMGIEPVRAYVVGGEHSSKEVFEQLINRSSEHLHELTTIG